MRLAERALWPLVAYGLGFALLAWLTGAVARRSPERSVAIHLRPAALDLAGWAVGILLAEAASALRWTRILLLQTALALLAVEAARNVTLRRTADHRAGKLERMQHAHARVFGESSGMEAIARQILAECRHVLPVQWFQIEIRGPGAPAAEALAATSWWAGPDGVLQEGRPRPPEPPRVLPGIHRRVAWRIVDTPLEVEGEVLAAVRSAPHQTWSRRALRHPGSPTRELGPSGSPGTRSQARSADRRTGPAGARGPVAESLSGRLRERAPVCGDHVRHRLFQADQRHPWPCAGDHALVAVAHALENQRREGDFCCRYGGRSSPCCSRGSGGERALQLAERLRRAVASLDIVFEERQIPLTLSAGVAAFPELYIKAAAELLLLADEALYEAKEQGRNRCLLNLGQGTYRTATGALTGRRPGGRRPGVVAASSTTRLPRIFS